ncbi:MAG: hypothetical protein A2293_05525 [Elusimicrobia bacterium RIFOXYB2_FULL_49_7]|nr:MAG: hypothetical protein A2293_05525 [Elusimicrobia bacterium RIFOXYB2_FULL_49_7]
MEQPRRILVVDDEPDIATMTSFRLRKAGFEVLVATDGGMGLAVAAKEKIDLVLLDLGLPVIDGKEVCRRLKSDEALKHIPVIILSASSDRIDEIVKESKADSYVVKPYEPEALLSAVRKFIRS